MNPSPRPLLTPSPASSTLQDQRRPWIGHWLMAVAVLHTVFALVFLRQPLLGVVQRGVFNTVGQDPMTAAAVWFLLFGAVLALLALAITALERSGDGRALRRQGWGLLALCVFGVVLMPDSGFWLAMPAAMVLIRRNKGAPATARSEVELHN